MIVLKKPKVAKKDLVLGDYVTVHAPCAEGEQISTGTPRGVMHQHDEFFKRIFRQRGELKEVRHRGNNLISMCNNVISKSNKHREVMQNSTLRRSAG